MSEESFREEVEKLREKDHTQEYPAEVIHQVSASGTNERFSVYVFRTRKGYYKLQWVKGGHPELPKLTKKMEEKAKSEFKNIAYLTSGFGSHEEVLSDIGIKDIDELMLVIKELKSLGIIIEI